MDCAMALLKRKRRALGLAAASDAAASSAPLVSSALSTTTQPAGRKRGRDGCEILRNTSEIEQEEKP
ncbi:hypothetical protein EYF80_056748 [Liparis tanakae]|uniref:Uncharacterized protein n=1 Tax=Liparis tanakae TaxID=230148 RepID=A0A4Z2EW16_9TELE|nr:hypothetical protein EYF80_056748 [Liparis tanakae]